MKISVYYLIIFILYLLTGCLDNKSYIELNDRSVKITEEIDDKLIIHVDQNLLVKIKLNSNGESIFIEKDDYIISSMSFIEGEVNPYNVLMSFEKDNKRYVVLYDEFGEVYSRKEIGSGSTMIQKNHESGN